MEKFCPIFRRLAEEDYNKGYLALLETLTTVGDISEQEFKDRFQKLVSNPLYHIWVIEDPSTQTIIGSGTLLIEEKFIHKLGKVGHIEDIVISPDYQGMKLGKSIINQLIKIARKEGCYKVILDCSEKVCGFYERCGFYKKEIMMRLDL